MVKPQFEVGKDRVGKGGVVRDPDLRAEAVAGGGRGRSRTRAGAPGPCAAARCPGRRATSSSSCGCAAGSQPSTPEDIHDAVTVPSRRGCRMRGLTREHGTQRRPDASGVRRVLLLAHTGRDAAREVSAGHLQGADRPRRRGADAGGGGGRAGAGPGVVRPALELTDGAHDAGADCELAVVVGGDGSILRAAEVTCDSGTPVLGVNLGHVGFLAEAESDDVEYVIEAIVRATWTAEDRLTLDVEGLPRRRAGDPHVRPQRGQRGEGGPRADARGHRRDRQPAAVPVGLRRGGDGDADRLHGLQLQRRRAGGVAGASRRCWWCRSARTRCSRDPWWSRPTRCSPSR